MDSFKYLKFNIGFVLYLLEFIYVRLHIGLYSHLCYLIHHIKKNQIAKSVFY